MQVAVFGLGYWGTAWVRTLAHDPAVDRIVGVDPGSVSTLLLDHPPSKLHVERDPLRVLTDGGIAAAVVAAPPGQHYDLARRCLEFGKHVLVEKPATLGLGPCMELVRLAEMRGLVLMAGHTSLFTPEMRCVQRVVDQGQLGTLVSFDSFHGNFGIPHTNVDVVWDLAPHPLSLFTKLFPDTVSRVEAVAHEGEDGRSDAAHWILETSGGAVAHSAVSWRHPLKTRTWMVGGTNGTMVVDEIADKDRVRLYHTDEAGLKFRNSTPPRFETLSFDTFEPLREELSHFLDCIIQLRPPISGGEHVLKVTDLLCRIHTNKGGRVHG